MEKLVRVKAQGAPVSFQSQQGETVTKIPVVMTDGIDTFEAEAFDKLAVQLANNPLNGDVIYNAQMQLNVREWTNQQGQVVRSNSIRLLRIAPL